MRGVRSDYLRAVVKAAVAQGFEVEHGGKHPVLVCPVCGHPEIITGSGRQTFHEARNKVCRLRRHGFIWKGIGGKHAEEDQQI